MLKDFDNEVHSQTKDSSTSIGSQAEVESAAGLDNKPVELQNEGALISKELWGDEDLITKCLESRKSRNLAVVLYYEAALGSPPREECMGIDGNILYFRDFQFKKR